MSGVVAGRLRRLATARSTGTLPFTGSGGAIHLADGLVVAAESAGTPAGQDAGQRPDGPLGRLAAALGAAEPVADATLDLMSGTAAPARFKSGKSAGPASGGISVERLLTEIARRQHLLQQVSDFVTPDTQVQRNSPTGPGDIQVSAAQWALFVRVDEAATPRELAWKLQRSVFGTTIEVYRLLRLRVLAPVGQGTAHGAEPGVLPMSYLRAVTGQPGAGW